MVAIDEYEGTVDIKVGDKPTGNLYSVAFVQSYAQAANKHSSLAAGMLEMVQTSWKID
jgi:hypothetical protein